MGYEFNTHVSRSCVSHPKEIIVNILLKKLNLTGIQFDKIQNKTHSEEIHLVNSILELKTRND